MENKRKMKLGVADRVILGTGYGLLGIFCILILIPLAYVVAASFMDPNVLNNQGISFLYEAAAREEIEKGELEVIDLYDFHFLHEFNYITLQDSVFKEQYDAFFASVCRP